MFLEDCDEMITVSRLDQMNHFMNNDIFQQVLRLLHQFRIQPNTFCLVVAAPHFVFIRWRK